MTERAPRGIRNNNPGNLDYVGQPGAHLETGVTDPRFAVFPTMADGIRALRDQLVRYGGRGLNTVQKVVSTFAPSTENATDAYVGFVCAEMGVSRDQVVDLNDISTQAHMCFAITEMENGFGFTSLDEIIEALEGKDCAYGA